MPLPDVVPAPVIEVVPAESEALRAAMCPVAVHGQIAVNDFVIEAVRTVRNDLVATMCDAPADSASDPADMNARLVVIEHLLLRLEAALLRHRARLVHDRMPSADQAALASVLRAQPRHHGRFELAHPDPLPPSEPIGPGA